MTNPLRPVKLPSPPMATNPPYIGGTKVIRATLARERERTDPIEAIEDKVGR